jgi:hypothetical protein
VSYLETLLDEKETDNAEQFIETEKPRTKSESSGKRYSKVGNNGKREGKK